MFYKLNRIGDAIWPFGFQFQNIIDKNMFLSPVLIGLLPHLTLNTVLAFEVIFFLNRKCVVYQQKIVLFSSIMLTVSKIEIFLYRNILIRLEKVLAGDNDDRILSV